jgi:hypothetical protein
MRARLSFVPIVVLIVIASLSLGRAAEAADVDSVMRAVPGAVLAETGGGRHRVDGGCSGSEPEDRVAIRLVRHPHGEDGEYDNRLDPSGIWESESGTLSLMHDANRLSFAYLSVFGPTAHICEGAGVAGLAGRDRYEFVDESGTVAFILDESGVRIVPVEGSPAFCGAGWRGDAFSISQFAEPRRCEVTVGETRFRVVDHVDSVPRRARAARGDRVDVVDVPGSFAESMVLARREGPDEATVGLLLRSEVRCLGPRID